MPRFVSSSALLVVLSGLLTAGLAQAKSAKPSETEVRSAIEQARQTQPARVKARLAEFQKAKLAELQNRFEQLAKVAHPLAAQALRAHGETLANATREIERRGEKLELGSWFRQYWHFPGQNAPQPACTTPVITSLSVASGEPGAPVVITGHGFGSTPSTISFFVSPGLTVQGSVDYWQDGEIITTVPYATGIAAAFEGAVYVKTCAESNAVSFQFEPEIVQQTLDIIAKHVQWSDSNCVHNGPPGPNMGAEEWGCSIQSGSAYQALTGGIMGGAKNDDEYFSGLVLHNGWTLASVELGPVYSPFNGAAGASLEDVTIGSSSPHFKVHSYVNATDTEAYEVTVYVSGPNGVSF